ncbi:hypothetical protein INS49_006421 [Diaporthe citri]|uniref:uncharacterized protein n=1 Tax=Diaporthe citri TaxID=83186 RepID=UPI001C8185C5|nr:uncharacterized protein INS49_006421 [Diaporthe citri]KAG6364817.1 hypothetical protein INS49_006421 [Diaporthe citri]
MWRCHQKYGDKVRYAPNRLNVNTVSALRSIYAEGKPYTKSKNYTALLHQAANSLTVLDRKDHGRRRRVIQAGLADSTVRDFYPDMFAIINRFCDRLLQTAEEEASDNSTCGNLGQSDWTNPRNMADWCNWLTFDLMFSFIFTDKYNMLERQQYRYIPKVIEASNIRVSALLQAPILKMFRVDKLLFPRAIAARNIFLRFVGKLLRDTSRADSSQRTNLFQMLRHTQDPVTGRGFTPEEMVAESVTLVVAGGDTSATAVSAVFFYLSRNPAAYSRARAEVRAAFTSVQDIIEGTTAAGSLQKLNSCRYLRACIDEAMRMSPSVGQSLAREVPAGGAVVDGDLIPPGCDVGVPIYSIQHNEKYFPDPFDFNPERWLVDRVNTPPHVQEQLADQHTAHNPFSLGPRSCMGKGVALVEMMATFAVVLYRLEFKMASDDKSGGRPGAGLGRHRSNEFQLRDHITSARDGPVLRFRASA